MREWLNFQPFFKFFSFHLFESGNSAHINKHTHTHTKHKRRFHGAK